MKNPDGTESTTHEQLTHTLLSYFHDIFAVNASANQVNAEPVTMEGLSQTHHSHIQPHDHSSEVTNHSPLGQLDQDQMIYTDSIPTMQELHSIIKSMRSNASPGPDGLNVAFYKSAWSWVGPDIHKMVHDFYTQAFMNPEINQTYLVLIQKRRILLFLKISDL